jgi:hypothetical protein
LGFTLSVRLNPVVFRPRDDPGLSARGKAFYDVLHVLETVFAELRRKQTTSKIYVVLEHWTSVRDVSVPEAWLRKTEQELSEVY